MRFMNWLTKSRAYGLPASDPRFASAAEIQEAFAAQHEHLLWLAEVITGDAELASQCVVDARRLSSAGPGMFRDWLLQWARSSTVRSAVDCMRNRVAAESDRYEHRRCTHGGHAALTSLELERLEKLAVAAAISGLDSFARAVLIVRGVRGSAIQECALMLGASRSAVTSAYCAALDWMSRELERNQSETQIARSASASGGHSQVA